MLSDLFVSVVATTLKPKIDQSTSRRTELPQLDPGLLEDCCCLRIHVVALTEHHLTNPYLSDFNTTRQARTRIAIEYTPLSDPLPSSLQQRILFRMQTQTRAQPRPSARTDIASSTTAVVAVSDPTGVPLYPVLMTRLLCETRTQPTRRFMQLERCAAREARVMK